MKAILERDYPTRSRLARRGSFKVGSDDGLSDTVPDRRQGAERLAFFPA